MKVVRFYLLLVFVLLYLPSMLLASEVRDAKVKAVNFKVTNGSIVFFQLDVSPNKPQGHCGTNSNVDFAFDSATPAGKNILAAVLSAYATQKNVYVGGDDTCTVGAEIVSNVENLLWFRQE